MSDSKKPELPDLPEKFDSATKLKNEEPSVVVSSVEDSTAAALSDALSSSFKIIQGLMVGVVIIFLCSGFYR